MPTFNANILPTTTGKDLGSDAQRWDAYLQDVDISGAITGGFDPSGIPGPPGAKGDTGAPGAGSTPLERGFVNVMTDYNTVVGDGITDDYAAIQAILTANPGKTILFPKRRAASLGGGAASLNDYYCSQRLVFPDGNCTVLKGGAGPANWSGGTAIKFASGVGGVQIGKTSYACGLVNMELIGQDLWTYTDSATFEDFTSMTALVGDGADGLQLLGGEPIVHYCTITGFKRHGIFIDGSSSIQNPSQPDKWEIKGGMVGSNRAYGVYCKGGDANAGMCSNTIFRYNGLGGINDSAQLQNTWVQTLTDGNTRSAITAGATKTIAAVSGIVVAGNVGTITTTTAHGWTNGWWITSSGSDDTGFNGTFKLLSVPTTTTATFAITHADGTTQNGSVAKSSSTQIYAQYTTNSLDFGPYIASGAGPKVFINPYSETSVQQSPKFGANSIVIGGNEVTGNTYWPTVLADSPIRILNQTGAMTVNASTGLTVDTKNDGQVLLNLYAGTTVNPTKLIRWGISGGGTIHWTMGGQSVSPIGTLPNFILKDNAGNFILNIAQGATCDFAPAGNVRFFANKASVAQADGKVTTSGGLAVTTDAAIVESTSNSASWTYGSASELLTLSTSGLTTDTSANLLPANSIIESVVARVTTTITTTTNWALGDATISGRFAAANSTLTAGTTTVGLVHIDQTGTSGPRQTSAAKLRVTCTGSNPGAGAIRITVFYRQFVAPTS